MTILHILAQVVLITKDASYISLCYTALMAMRSDRYGARMRRRLAFLNRLENKRTKYLTGLYIVLKAVKREKP